MEKVKMFRKSDIAIVIVLLVFAAAGLFVFRMTHRGEGNIVRITIDGDLFGEYELGSKAKSSLTGTDSDSSGTDEEGLDAIAGGDGYLNYESDGKWQHGAESKGHEELASESSQGKLKEGKSVSEISEIREESNEPARKIEIPGRIGKCFLVIKNGEAYMESADCPNQICVKHSSISHKGETIVCLPNRIIIEIE